MKALFLESVAGVAGDMFAASFLDAGIVSREELEAIPATLGLSGVRVVASKVSKASISSTYLDVKWEGTAWQADVAFHEVGAVDSIVDVVMAATCVARSGAEKFFATPVKLGRGLITIEHGTHAVPPPASARLAIGLKTASVPAAITRENVELSTPTGLAILKALEPEFVDGVPAGVARAQGMGAGTMDLGAYPNVFRVVALDADVRAASALPYESDTVVELCCNLDDETGERAAWVAEQMLAKGALDAWTAPVAGKKGRVALQLSVLAEETRFTELVDWLLRNSSTFGVRHRRWERLKLARRFEKRGELTYKIGLTTDGKVVKEKAEYEELRRLWEKDPTFKP
ncbi:MAG: LarC family nickel insertion protein [Deltaproteobacteria bacterium]|nr:LarC family nickel insertion protein [Deltaproteobacteria bacterium]